MRTMERVFPDAKTYRGSTPQNSWEGRRATKRIERTATMTNLAKAANPTKPKKEKTDEPSTKPTTNSDKPTTSGPNDNGDKGKEDTEEIKAPANEKAA